MVGLGAHARAATFLVEVRQMKSVSIAGAFALLLALAACGGGQENQDTTAATGADAGQTAYSAAGAVTAIAGDRVTISHGPVEGLGWPAMTMTFRAGDPAMLRGISVGDRVTFRFRQQGNDYPLTSLGKAQ